MTDHQTRLASLKERLTTRRCHACRKRYRRRLPNCPTCKSTPGRFNDGPMNYPGFGGEGAAWRDKWFR